MGEGTILSLTDLNELYHLMRKAALTDGAESHAVRSIAHHLLSFPAYRSLNTFSDYYGTRYLLTDIIIHIKEWRGIPRHSRIVDVGCGTGWLGKGLAAAFNANYILVDKRYSSAMGDGGGRDIVWFTLDLELLKDLDSLQNILRSDDLIVMCDVLHCLTGQKEILDTLGRWDIAAIEYQGLHPEHLSSYDEQIRCYGAEGKGIWESIVVGSFGETSQKVVLGSHVMYMRKAT